MGGQLTDESATARISAIPFTSTDPTPFHGRARAWREHPCRQAETPGDALPLPHDAERQLPKETTRRHTQKVSPGRRDPVGRTSPKPPHGRIL